MTSTSWAQDKKSGKFKFYEQKIYTENFESAAQVEILKGEARFFLKTAECSQNHSAKCPSLIVSPGMFPVDFCGTSQLPV